MRTVDRAAGPVHEKRLVRLEGLVLVQPADRVVRQVFAEVVALLHGLWRQDARRVANQVRLVLRGLAGEETVEVLEAEAGRPVLERAGRSGLLGRCVVPFAPGACGVTVILQYVSHQRTAPGNVPGITVPVVRQLSDLPGTDAMVIAAGQQSRPSGRTHRRGVKTVVRDPFVDHAIHRRSLDFTSERGGQAWTRVVDQHDKNIRCVGWKPPRLHPLLVDRLLHRSPSGTGRWRRGKRQGILSFRLIFRIGHSIFPGSSTTPAANLPDLYLLSAGEDYRVSHAILLLEKRQTLCGFGRYVSPHW